MLTRRRGPPFEGKNRSTGDGGARLSDIFDKWKAERNPPVKTASDFGTYVRRFIEVNGDVAVKSITKSHVVTFKDAMLKYPARLSITMSKNTVPQILTKFKEDKTTPRLSPRTVNDKALGAIGAVLGWALSNGHCETNAANGVKVAMGEVRTDKRGRGYGLGYPLPVLANAIKKVRYNVRKYDITVLT